MSRELTVCNRFGETIIHLEFVPSDPFTLRILDGTPEMQEAVRSLAGHDFDRMVVVNNRNERFAAKWGDIDYLDALAGYWRANFGWRADIAERVAGWESSRAAPPGYARLMGGTLGRTSNVYLFLQRPAESAVGTNLGSATRENVVYAVHQPIGGLAYAASSGNPR